MFNNKLKKVAEILKDKKLTISTAESCTGGLLASRLTDIPGSSQYLNESHVVYANTAKQRYLGVKEETLKNFGAVSSQCAFEMAEGLKKLTNADVCVCTTGIAGPGAESTEKPAGLIYISVNFLNSITVREFRLSSFHKRKNMKFLFTEKALSLVYEVLLSHYS